MQMLLQPIFSDSADATGLRLIRPSRNTVVQACLS